MKLTFSIGTVLAVAMAHASFELMVIPGNDGRIYRLDPQNQILLGSFVALPNMTGVVSNGQGVGYGIGGTYVSGYNLFTGEPTTGLAPDTALWPTTYTSVGHLLSSASTYLHGIRVSTMSSTGYGIPSGITLMSVFQTPTGIRGIGRNTTTGDMISYEGANTNGLGGSPTTIAPSAFWGGNGIGQAATDIASDSSAFCYNTPAGGLALYRRVGASAFFQSVDGTLFDLQTRPAVAYGHDTLYIVGKSSTAGRTRIARYRTGGSNFVAAGDFEVIVDAPTTSKYSVGMINAPEPASMIALSVGVAAILRRRRAS